MTPPLLKIGESFENCSHMLIYSLENLWGATCHLRVDLNLEATQRYLDLTLVMKVGDQAE